LALLPKELNVACELLNKHLRQAGHKEAGWMADKCKYGSCYCHLPNSTESEHIICTDLIL
jgi:hypothetical protein